MKKILITGARGFIGRNLATRLTQADDLMAFPYDLENEPAELTTWLGQADVVLHLAGINRPRSVDEYEAGNAGFTEEICQILRRLGRTPKIVMSSSIQAEQDNPYGTSKRRAEESLKAFSRETGAPVSIYRLKNVFGKWCRPNYNSVTATFCHNIAHDLPISISDPAREIELIYVDDVVERFLEELHDPSGPDTFYALDAIPSTRITLGDLAGRIQAFHEMKSSLVIPDFADRFNR
ncbi:MAG: NAD-dependent epimerase/dehydratase family protein, partial [Planctomycetaceae bacterium]